ncbi:MAG: Cytoplasmic GTPase/eEF2-like protein (ribosomal biogenesis) [Chaenotheca gracillima]|nr:MAG: Cytoplasmic GTPase/eEF2-like protein (ribosomal biogenesis) [Chaenotheca gracillima]
MAQTSSQESQAFQAPSRPRQIPQRTGLKITPSQSSNLSLPPSTAATGSRNGHLLLDTLSPVNQNGSFEFDRVLKAGEVQKRTRKTKTWKTAHLVLRPNLLSIYKKPGEIKLHRQITLSDLTAVAFLKDPKRDHVFGLFSPSKNYHLQAKTDKDVHEWVDLIRQEARIDEEEEEMFLASPGGRKGPVHGFGRQFPWLGRHEHQDRLGSSSPEPLEHPFPQPPKTRESVKVPPVQRQASQNLDYSGNELGSHSDFSDIPPEPGVRDSSLSLSQPESRAVGLESVGPPYAANPRAAVARNVSRSSGLDMAVEDERVIWHGQLLCLVSKGGVRRWKNVWTVLRSRQLALYKNKDEYSAILLIPLSTIINAVEIDPISKSKAHCMQIILPSKSYRFCAPDEEALMKWLGALKSLFAKRKEAERKRGADGGGAAAASGS